MSWNGDGTVGDFHAYGVSFDSRGHETRRLIEYDFISYTKHNNENWQDFSRYISAPLPCSHHEKVFKKQKVAEKMLHEVMQKASVNPPTLEYQSKLAELTRLLEAEPSMSLNGLFTVIAKPLLGDVRLIQMKMKQDFEEQAASLVHAFTEKAAVIASERAKLNGAAANERASIEATIQTLEKELKQCFNTCVSALLIDIGEQIQKGIDALQHLARDPQMRNVIGIKNSEKQLAALKKLNTPEIRTTLQALNRLQEAFLVEVDRVTPAFREMLEAHRSAAQEIPPEVPNP